jgi:acyl-CoA synthetase (AMP-forming)/AMP-acid ligase II
VFPVKHLRAFKERVPDADFFNLYGPTETNVCTWYRIPDAIPADRTEPYPIGRACDHVRTRVVDGAGLEVTVGEEGELCVAGAGVMLGYWGRPDETERSFLVDDAGERWYRTGDIVREVAGEYLFLGRRDRMVKRRGYRIELGEVEAGVYRHPDVQEVAAVAVPDGEGGVRIRVAAAFGDRPRPSLVELKSFCAEVLPLYMVPDEFLLCDALPKTSTDKVDLRRLAERA